MADLLLITGAGAARNLGSDGRPLPLMADWANVLVGALEQANAGLANACGLSTGMAAQDFEETIGALLQWRQAMPLEERFRLLGGLSPSAEHGEVTSHRGRVASRLTTFIKVLNETLFQEFGQHRVDDDAAEGAYRRLFEMLQAQTVAIATTNYDRSGHAALARMGQDFTTGFTRELAGRTPVFEAGAFRDLPETTVPVLHLHGCVGWYSKDGTIRDHGADQPFFENFGAPVVLYPDPRKEPLNEATVSTLWDEFKRQLSEARRVVIVGHSLHDPALVQAIRDAELPVVAVTYFNESEVKWIKRQLPKATALKANFGPDLDLELPPQLS